VQGLMDVTGVVDHEADSEGTGLVFVGEVSLDARVVVGRLVGGALTRKPFSESGQSLNNVVLVHLELGEVGDGGAGFVKVWLVNEVPAGLEGVALALDVIGEKSALGHGVVFLVFGELGVGLLESNKLVKDGLIGSVVLGLEQLLSTSGDDKVTSTPEGFNLADGKSSSNNKNVRSHL